MSKDIGFKLEAGINTDEFFKRIKIRYAQYDEKGAAFTDKINSLISERTSLTLIKNLMLSEDVKSVLNLNEDYITTLKLLKISEDEINVGENPFIYLAPSMAELTLIDKITFLYLLRIEFDFEREYYIELADHIAETGISALYLAQTVTSGNFKRPAHLFDTLIDILSEKGHTVTAMKLSALKEHYLG